MSCIKYFIINILFLYKQFFVIINVLGGIIIKIFFIYERFQ